MRTPSSPRRSSGFTLIELMVVVAIIGILSGIAMAQYQDYVSRSRWSDSLTSVGQLKAAMAECMQNQNGANAAPANCWDFAAAGSLRNFGYLPSNWTGPATPTYAAAPASNAVGANGVAIVLTGTSQAGSCQVTLTATTSSNQLGWTLRNTGGPASCNRTKTGVGT